MAEGSAIEWTDHTFNGWIGCTKVGPGCDHCYAEALATTRLGVPWGPGAPRRRTAASTWAQPRRWDRRAVAAGVRERVFCSSLADVFDNEVDPAWRADLFALIRETPHLDWLLVTKRIGNAGKMAEAAGGWPANVWLGATIVDQVEAGRDVSKLLSVDGPRFRFLSMEPLLGPVDLVAAWGLPPKDGNFFTAEAVFCDDPYCARGGVHWAREFGCRWGAKPRGFPGLDWIIVGGESGPGARPMHPDWARRLRDQCADAGVPFLFKQWGEWADSGQRIAQMGVVALQLGAAQQLAWPDGTITNSGAAADHGGAAAWLKRIGKKAAGRLLDGVTHDAVPA